MKLANKFLVSHLALRPVQRTLLGLAIFFSLAAIPLPAQSSPGQAAASTVSLHDRVWIASQVYSDIQTYFGHWRAVPDLDFDKEFQSYIDQILANDDRRTFVLATTALVAKLQNGHSGFGDLSMFEDFGQPLGLYACPIDSKWVVVRSSVKGVKPGDVIAGIDGEKIDGFYQSLSQYLSASDERWKRRALFESPYLFPQSFSLQLADGRKVAITRQGKPRFPGEEFTEDTVKEQRDFSYIRIPSFGKPNFEDDAVKAVHDLPKAKAIIFDIRGNHGGSTPSKLVDALMDRPYRWFAEATPLSIALFKSQGALADHSDVYWYGGVQQPGENPYRGDIYILVDGGCFSACEDFVMPFKNTHRATIVGERTAGSTGQPFVQNFGNGMVIQLSMKREFFANGEEFEGVGILPDVEIHTTAEDIASGRDPVMARVAEMVRAKAYPSFPPLGNPSPCKPHKVSLLRPAQGPPVE